MGLPLVLAGLPQSEPFLLRHPLWLLTAALRVKLTSCSLSALSFHATRAVWAAAVAFFTLPYCKSLPRCKSGPPYVSGLCQCCVSISWRVAQYSISGTQACDPSPILQTWTCHSCLLLGVILTDRTDIFSFLCSSINAWKLQNQAVFQQETK